VTAALSSGDGKAPAALRNRVLLVDDEHDFRNALAELLEANGYQVAICSSFREARSLLRSGSFDLVLAEFRLPHGDGIELLEEARQWQPRARLFLHSSVMPLDLAHRAGHLGIERVWIKFTDLKILLDQMRSSPVALSTPDPLPVGTPAPSPGTGRTVRGRTDASRRTPFQPFLRRIAR
jgi:two-component system response regulator HydG